ncbi:PAS domain S-box protein [Candidatus Acetothermia bacterium]|nr:PAS domain S-box protein [Candidatus Acetothermia bacterium]
MTSAKSRGLRWKFLLYFLGLIILPLLISGAVIVWQMFQASYANAQALEQSHGQLAQSKIDESFSKLEKELDDLVNNRSFDRLTTEEQRAAAYVLLFNYKSLLSLKLLDPQGADLIYLVLPGVIVPPESVTEAKDPVISGILNSKMMHASLIQFFGDPPQPYLTIHYPILDKKTTQVTRILVATIGFGEAQDIIGQIQFGEKGHAYLVDEQGHLLAHPDLAHFPVETQVKIPLASGIQTGLSGVQSILSVADLRFEQNLMHIVTEIPVAESYRFATQVAWIISGLLLFALITAVIFQVSLTRRVIKPIESLHHAAMAVHEGDLSQRASVGGDDQMGTLGTAFNAMVARLEEVVRAQLSNIAELEKLNQVLQKEMQERSRVQKVLDNIFGLSEDLIGVAALNGKFEMINPAFSTALGYSEEELKESLFIERVHSDDQPAIRAMMRRLAHGERLAQIETRIQCKDGSYKWFSWNAQLLPERSRIFVVARDISARKAIEERQRELVAALAKSNRELERFAYITSHDLQEPLRKIQAFGERLEVQAASALDEKGLHYLDRMKDSAQRLQILINDLLTYSRVSTRNEERVPVDLDTIVKNVLSDLEVQLERTAGRVEVNGLPAINANPTLMHLLFQNLISNGLKFHREGVPPVVRISSRDLHSGPRSRAFCEISITDNGIGFEHADSERMFEVFQRLHSRSEYEGTGIGLAICKKIVERHGGTITAQGKPGEGATFTIRLPQKGRDDQGPQDYAETDQ